MNIVLNFLSLITMDLEASITFMHLCPCVHQESSFSALSWEFSLHHNTSS